MFDSLDMENSEVLQKKLYEFFFIGPQDMKKNYSKEKTSKDADSEMKTARGMTLSEDLEEKKKRMQLKMDLELIEFEERGGFAKVLRDIFNPNDVNSMELDSVY